MRKSALYIICAMLVSFSVLFAQTEENLFKMTKTKPGKLPELFAAGIVATGLAERDMAISPNYDEIFYTIKGPIYCIAHLKFEDGKWSKSEIAKFSGRYNDLEPAFSPDGKKLFFVSKRPVKPGGDARKDYDIWYLNKTKIGWSKPIHAGNVLNSEKNEFYPSIANDGSVYFTGTREDCLGGEDIYVSRWVAGKFTKPENLGPKVNSKQFEFNAYISPDESYLLFGSAGRKDSIGGGDIYLSINNKEHGWSDAVVLNKDINTTALDYCPYVTSDGKYFFFTSKKTGNKKSNIRYNINDIKKVMTQPGNGNDDIYWMDAGFLKEILSSYLLK